MNVLCKGGVFPPTTNNPQPCARCPALVASRQRIVHGYGDAAARIVFVGEAPGRHGADKTGIPFTGDRSGQRLQRMLHALGLADSAAPTESPRLRCFVTNVVRCCPPNNRTPVPSEIANCAPWLEAEFAQIDPQIIVPIGRLALTAIAARYLGYDPGPIRPLHATVLPAGNRLIIPMVHPSRISRAQAAAFVETMRSLV